MMNSRAQRELIAFEVKRCRDAFEGYTDEVKSWRTQAAQILHMSACMRIHSGCYYTLWFIINLKLNIFSGLVVLIFFFLKTKLDLGDTFPNLI